MKYFVIERGKVFYMFDGDLTQKKSIDQISKEELMKMLNLCLEDDNFEMDMYDDSKVQNAAHQIIYKNIYQKLNDIRMRRVSFEDEKISLYRSAINKYSKMTEPTGY